MAGGLALFFLLHGAGTLILESVWVRAQVALFGAVPEATGSVLLAYFLGIALGSWRWRDRDASFVTSAAFAARFAAAIAASILIPVLLLHALPLLGGSAAAGLLARPVLFAVAFVAVLPACVCLGAFFPAAGAAGGARRFVLLYGLEAAGSLAGVALGALLLPAALGFLATGAAGGLVLLAAFAILRRAAPAHPVPAHAAPAAAAVAVPRRWAVAAFGSGLLSIVLEVLWMRLVSLDSDSSVYAFGAVSLLVILLAALAALLVAGAPGRWVRAPGLPAAALLAVVAAGLGAGALFRELTGGLAIRLVTSTAGLGGALRTAAPLVLAGSLAPSFLLPLVLRLAAPAAPGRFAAAGPLLAANAVGCAAGALLGAFVLLPAAGIWGTLAAALAGYLALLPAVARGRTLAAAAAAGAALLAVFSPLGSPLVTPTDPFAGPPGRLVSVREGRHGIVAVVDYPGRARSLWLNNTYLLEAFTGDARATERLGIIPAVLRPGARRALVIGVGTGATAAGLLRAPVGEVDLVELVPEVAAAAARHFADVNRGALADPRVRLIVDDGRRRLARSAGGYDLVVGDLVTPWNEGAADLFSLEHFRTVRARLAPGGVFVLWLPLYQLTRAELLVIARTLAEAFPAVSLWQLGSQSGNPVAGLVAGGALPLAAIAAGLPGERGAGEEPVLRHLSGALSHYVGPVDLAQPLWRGVPLNTLDRPLLGFMAARAGRALLTGRPYLDLAEELYDQEANPGGRIFSAWGGEQEQWRQTGRALGRYAWHLQNGEYAAAAALEARISALPAFDAAGR